MRNIKEFNNIINATILQVVAGYIGSILYLIELADLSCQKIYQLINLLNGLNHY